MTKKFIDLLTALPAERRSKIESRAHHLAASKNLPLTEQVLLFHPTPAPIKKAAPRN